VRIIIKNQVEPEKHLVSLRWLPKPGDYFKFGDRTLKAVAGCPIAEPSDTWEVNPPDFELVCWEIDAPSVDMGNPVASALIGRVAGVALIAIGLVYLGSAIVPVGAQVYQRWQQPTVKTTPQQ
jgi:hypothetical protein